MKKNLVKAAFSILILFVLTSSAYPQWVSTNWQEGSSFFSLYSSEGSVFARTWDSYNGGSVFFTDDQGLNWSMISSSDSDIDILSIVMKDNKVLAGTWDGFYSTKLNGIFWELLEPAGLPQDIVVWSTAVINDTFFAGATGEIYQSSLDDVNNWTNISTGIPWDSRITCIVNDGETIFAGSDNYGVFIKAYGETSWTAINSGLTDLHISNITVAGSKLYAVTLKDGVFVTDINDIDLESEEDNVIWQKYDSGLEKINCFLTYDNLIFAGTDSNGVYLSDDNGQSWLLINSGMAQGSRIWSMTLCDDNIFAGTSEGVMKINPADINNYTISASASEGGTISPEGDTIVYEYDSRTFTITPMLGYLISDVCVDGNSVGIVDTYTFSNVTESHTISVDFIQVEIHTITASTSQGGVISPSGEVMVSGGTSKQFIISPLPGNAIENVIVDGNSVGAVSTYTFTNITGDHTISATFKEAPYIITVSASAGGSVSPSGMVEVWGGESQTFTITPTEGYEISNVLVDGVSVGQVSSYTLSNVRNNHTIIVTFSSLIVYQINCGGGQVSTYAGDQYYSDGSEYSESVTIDVSGIVDPAPEAVYQTERYGDVVYTFPNLESGLLYKVRLHFSENYQSSTGSRRFNVTVNGNTMLWDYDILAEAGSMYKAVVVEYTTLANSSNQLIIQFTTLTDNAKISGIEIVKQQ